MVSSAESMELTYFRQASVEYIMRCVQAGECCSIVGISNVGKSSLLRLLDDPTVGLVFGFVVLAPIGEELLMRRIVFSTLAVSNGRLIAYIASGLIFALMHMNPTVIPGYIWMAACFAAAYELTGSVWSAVVVHAANNLIAVSAHILGWTT